MTELMYGIKCPVYKVFIIQYQYILPLILTFFAVMDDCIIMSARGLLNLAVLDMSIKLDLRNAFANVTLIITMSCSKFNLLRFKAQSQSWYSSLTFLHFRRYFYLRPHNFTGTFYCLCISFLTSPHYGSLSGALPVCYY